MEKLIIDCKETEYLSRYYLAAHTGKQEKARKLALATLMMLRQQSRIAHLEAESLWGEARGLKRAMKKMSEAALKFPLGELRVKKLENDANAAQKELARVGEEIYQMLELWQQAGATFEDLCNLCNRDPAQVRRELGPKELDARPDASFSKLAMVFNLDYKNPRDTGILEDSVDAPLTHALKAYMLDTMLHTEAGRKAAHEALEAVFPEVMENAMTVVTDEDGIRHLIDKDGVDIGALDGEGDAL